LEFVKKHPFKIALMAGVALCALAWYATDADAAEVTPPASTNWTGPYVGAHVGYATGDATTTQDVADWGTDPKWIGPFDYDVDGAFGGATVGYNWQVRQIVFGVEGDVGYMDLSGTRTSESSTPIYHQDHTVEGGLYALIAGRVGFAFGNTLLYGKGGYLWLDGEQDMTTTKPGFTTTKSDSMDGWAYGAGIEQSLGDGWSLKAEYLRVDLDDVDAAQTADVGGHVFENHTSFDAIDTFKIGVNRRF
jgi:outer membrane immunogenic protein